MMPWNRRYARLEELLRQVLATQKCIFNQLREIEAMAANAVTQEQFTTDLGKLQGDVTTLVTTVNALDVNVKQLKVDVAALKAANPGVDFSALDASVNQMSNTIETANANVQTEVSNPDAPPTDGGGTTAPPADGGATTTDGGASAPPATV